MDKVPNKLHSFIVVVVAGILIQSCSYWTRKENIEQNAEKFIDRKYIHPLVRLEPKPQSGRVEVNSPWMSWSPVLKSQEGYNTYKFEESYLYRGRVSRDPEFKDKSTIISEPREWCFFNPHQQLEPGIWYWQYAIIDEKNNSETWSETMSFEITGNENVFVTPPIEKVLENIPKDHPRVLASKDQIGKLPFPDEAVSIFINKMDALLGQSFPSSLIYDDESVLREKRENLTEVDYLRFIDKRTKEIYREQKFRLESMLKAYIVTGDEKYVNESLRRYNYLKAQYFNIVENGVSNDFTDGYYLNILSGMYDVCYDYIEAAERQYIKTTLIESQNKTYHHFLHRAGPYILDSHMWQFHLHTFLGTALSLVHDVPDAKKWVQYVYEVWTMRAPVGSRNDGGWFPGNGYLDANKGSLLIMPILLSRMTGVNYFAHPWYQNVGAYLTYTAPVGHIAGSYGDNADVKRENAMDFVIAYAHVTEDPFGKFYVELGDKLGNPQKRGIRKPKDEESRLPMGLDENGNLFWYMYHPLPINIKNDYYADFSRAKNFPDVGTVAVHTNLSKPDQNLMVSFRSSPFGMAGHSQASQNSFNIQYGGDPLFFRSGYYSSWADHHSLQCYKHTRAHNTVLADGMGQAFSTEGYGWIARFATGEKITYALGDASNAYNDTKRDELTRMFNKWNVAHTPENGFGDPDVSRFRRHVAVLENNIIIIYDELEAEKPVVWSWLVHSKDTLSKNGLAFYTENLKGKGLLNLYSGFKNLEFSVTDKFYAPAVDWLGNGWKRGIVYKNHWHGKVDTEKVKKARFLSIIQVHNKKDEFLEITEFGNGKFSINDWQIEAELNTANPPGFLCKKEKVGALSFNIENLEMESNQFVPEINGSTMLIEKSNGTWHKQEVIDTLPDEAAYF